MKNRTIILFCFMIWFGIYNLYSNEINYSESPVLFTDRDFCISGDTLWFKLWFPDFEDAGENIGRVQFEAIEGKVVSSVIVRLKEGWGQGYMFIPDSLGSGQYFITAYRNSQQNLPEFSHLSKSIFVYNRFDKAIKQIKTAGSSPAVKLDPPAFDVEVSTNKNTYNKREKVNLNLKIDPTTELKNVLVRATLLDPISIEYKGYYILSKNHSQNNIPGIKEKDGFLVSGQITDAEGNLQKSVLVTLSIPDASNYFDYYLTGSQGEFHFFLANATGQCKCYLQTFSKNREILKTEIIENSLHRDSSSLVENKLLTPVQTNFIDKVVQGDYIRRLFQASIPARSDFFEMPNPFQIPFYGDPKRRIIPAEYIDLDHFEEISKELLRGVRSRKTDNVLSIRLVNEEANSMFSQEPLRLLNGIPVSNNQLISPLKSKDISSIDLSYRKRVFGGLTFNGVMDIKLTDKSNKLFKKESNILEYNLNCIQPDKSPAYFENPDMAENQPDMRQTYLWKSLEPIKSHDIEFVLSDLKGKVEIRIELITANNEIIRTSKIIEVK